MSHKPIATFKKGTEDLYIPIGYRARMIASTLAGEAITDVVLNRLKLMYDIRIKETKLKCPWGGDENNCGDCFYFTDYIWDEEKQDCIRRED